MKEIGPASSLAHAERRAALAVLATRGATEVREVDEVCQFSGGPIQQNWLLRGRVTGRPHAGAHEWVLRIDSPSTLAASIMNASKDGRAWPGTKVC